jgi:hypothetical protein
MEIVETEMKYGRDLHIIQEEFYRPMLVAGLLTADQLAGVFLNLSELREWNRRFTDRLRDALEIALEHGDEDLLTVNLGRLFLQAASMLHAFETYCLRQVGYIEYRFPQRIVLLYGRMVHDLCLITVNIFPGYRERLPQQP